MEKKGGNMFRLPLLLSVNETDSGGVIASVAPVVVLDTASDSADTCGRSSCVLLLCFGFML
eukprot:m.177111 g.177111  ORF g.177111 m.177111 type:complete len:61 (+) comp13543_c0_seq6:121-303(+)